MNQAEASLVSAQASLASSQARYDKAVNGSRPEEILAAEATVNRLRSEEELTRLNLERAQTLFKQGSAAADEIASVCGNDIRRRLKPLAVSTWSTDPFARGAYSHALVGHAPSRATLAAPVDGRIFFAGEAVSKHDYSTAHGALRSGIDAAKALLADL